jgi:hypothetical protein
VLAAELDNEPLRQWASHELNGYPDEAMLPPTGRFGPCLSPAPSPDPSGAVSSTCRFRRGASFAAAGGGLR